jgi:t-SNARE complex subunit (syntaxin)
MIPVPAARAKNTKTAAEKIKIKGGLKMLQERKQELKKLAEKIAKIRSYL